jgi:hypothetical protein
VSGVLICRGKKFRDCLRLKISISRPEPRAINEADIAIAADASVIGTLNQNGTPVESASTNCKYRKGLVGTSDKVHAPSTTRS